MQVPEPKGWTCGSSTSSWSALATSMSWYFAVASRRSASDDCPPPAVAKPATASSGNATNAAISPRPIVFPFQTTTAAGSGRTITVSATLAISSTGRSAALAWRRIASGLDAW